MRYLLMTSTLTTQLGRVHIWHRSFHFNKTKMRWTTEHQNMAQIDFLLFKKEKFVYIKTVLKMNCTSNQTLTLSENTKATIEIWETSFQNRSYLTQPKHPQSSNNSSKKEQNPETIFGTNTWDKVILKTSPTKIKFPQHHTPQSYKDN